MLLNKQKMLTHKAEKVMILLGGKINDTNLLSFVFHSVTCIPGSLTSSVAQVFEQLHIVQFRIKEANDTN